jgi:TRAP-type uncharacterized transport system fused permease subunit
VPLNIDLFKPLEPEASFPSFQSSKNLLDSLKSGSAPAISGLSGFGLTYDYRMHFWIQTGQQVGQMTNSHTTQEKDEGLEIARKMAEEEEGIARRPQNVTKWVIPTIGVIWSFFQLSIASWWILDTVFIRSIHLGFALLIVYLNYPAFKTTRLGLKFLSIKDRIPWWDFVIAIVACFAAVYIAVDYAGINQRYGSPITRDLVIGLILLLMLLEAARRVIGPALSVIATFFCLYAFFGPYMPDVIAFKGVSLSRFFGQITMSTEGIYGIPLDVSATIVFLFVLFGSMLEKAGAGHYFIQLALSILGGFKGGPAKAAVMGSGFTGLVSGSSIANIVTTGTFTIP